MRVNDICYSPHNDRLYAASPGNWKEGNAVLVINPTSGKILYRIACGSEPYLVRLSSDGRYLYIGMRGSPTIRRYDQATGNFTDDILLEEYLVPPSDNHYPYYAGGIFPIPAQPGSILVAKIQVNVTPDNYNLAIFDDTITRPENLGTNGSGNDHLALREDGKVAWGIGHDYAPQAFTRYSIHAQGITKETDYPGILISGSAGFSYKNGRIYANTGQVFNVTGTGTPVLLATLNVGADYGYNDAITEPAIDSARFYLLTQFNPADPYTSNGYHLWVYNAVNNSVLREYILPEDFKSKISKVTSMGKGRVAMITSESPHNVHLTKLVIVEEKDCPAENIGLTLQGPVQYSCTGDTLALQGAPGYSEYFWSNGATEKDIQLTTHAFSLYYRVRGPNGCLSQPSNSITVIFEPKPNAPELTTSYLGEILCPDKTVSINAKSPGGNASYFVFNAIDTLPVSIPFTTPTPGLYTAIALSAHGCPSPASQIEIFSSVTDPLATPTIQVTGNLISCPEEPLILNAPAGAWGYQWSNGEKTRIIKPKWTGPYSVKLLYENGCSSKWSDTLDVEIKYTPKPLIIKAFSGLLYVDNSIEIGDSLQWYLNGQYIPGATGDSHFPTSMGIFTIRNFLQECSSVLSFPYVLDSTCQINIEAQPIGFPVSSYKILAKPLPASNYTYIWNNGSVNNLIQVTDPGTYCVTVTKTSDGCVTSNCIGIEKNNQIHVTMNLASQPNGDALAVLYNQSNAKFEVVDTVMANSLGEAFFENVQPGEYSLLGMPTSGHSLAKEYFPTYYSEGMHWQEADLIVHGGLRITDQPVTKYDLTLSPTKMAEVGPGAISGLVTEGPGFVASPGNTFGPGTGNGKGPLANIEMLLFDQNEQIALYTFTDTNGQFLFDDLPYGTYRVYINLPGKPVIFVEINLKSMNPVVDWLVFSVDKNDISVETEEPNKDGFHWWPNPVGQTLFFENTESLTWQITNIMGQILQSGEIVEKKISSIDISALPVGVYNLNIINNKGDRGAWIFIKQ